MTSQLPNQSASVCVAFSDQNSPRPARDARKISSRDNPPGGDYVWHLYLHTGGGREWRKKEQKKTRWPFSLLSTAFGYSSRNHREYPANPLCLVTGVHLERTRTAAHADVIFRVPVFVVGNRTLFPAFKSFTNGAIIVVAMFHVTSTSTVRTTPYVAMWYVHVEVLDCYWPMSPSQSLSRKRN